MEKEIPVICQECETSFMFVDEDGKAEGPFICPNCIKTLEPEPKRRFKYRILSLPAFPWNIEELKTLGADGWEVAAGIERTTLILKKEYFE